MARTFDGVDDKIVLSTGFDLSSTDWSFVAWVRPHTYSASHNGILGVTTSDSMYGISFINGILYAHIIGVGDSTGGATTNPTLNTWTHIGVDIVGTGSSRAVRYWCAGAAAGTGGFGGSSLPTVGRLTNAIGLRQADLFFDGEIAEAAIWLSLLSSGNYASLAGGASPLSIGTPALYMPICGLASPEPDYSTGGRTGTVTGTTFETHPSVTSSCVFTEYQSFYASRRRTVGANR